MTGLPARPVLLRVSTHFQSLFQSETTRTKNNTAEGKAQRLKLDLYPPLTPSPTPKQERNPPRMHVLSILLESCRNATRTVKDVTKGQGFFYSQEVACEIQIAGLS